MVIFVIHKFYQLIVVEAQYVIMPISSKSVKGVQRYGDLTVFKMDAICHLGFLKFKFLTVGAVERSILHQHAKFCEHRSNQC